jgi:sugar fermentation stimulation protein A
MRIERPLLEGAFVARENRFRARVRLEGREVAAHIPNSGRLTELLSPEYPVLLSEAWSPGRVTDYDMLMVSLPHTLVSVDARLPNQLLHEAFEAQALPQFEGYPVVRQEVTYGDSRLDFLLEADGKRQPCFIEVKSVTLVRAGVGYFPDAVTERGRRHLRELQRASLDGKRAAAIFVLQREDAQAFAPHDESDPAFGEALREVVADGVEVYAYSCQVSRREVVLHERIPVLLAKNE